MDRVVSGAAPTQRAGLPCLFSSEALVLAHPESHLLYREIYRWKSYSADLVMARGIILKQSKLQYKLKGSTKRSDLMMGGSSYLFDWVE